jgi:hypothetical protein
MTLAEIKAFVTANITYKPTWEFHVKEKNGVMFFQIQFVAADNATGVLERQYCRKWQLTQWMTTTELVRTIYKAIIAAEIHEASELFLYRGKAIFNPHMDVDALVVAADYHDCRPEPVATP